MSKAKEEKKRAGTVCILHGRTWAGMDRCPICEGHKANGDKLGVVCGCGNTIPYKPVRRFAFTAVLLTEADMRDLTLRHGLPVAPPGAHWLVGRADEGTRGYSPLPHVGLFETQDEALAKAAELNYAAGWADRGEAHMLVLSTMDAGGMRLKQLLREGRQFVNEAMGSEEIDPEAATKWLLEVDRALDGGK
jgi:hypothetical protein